MMMMMDMVLIIVMVMAMVMGLGGGVEQETRLIAFKAELRDPKGVLSDWNTSNKRSSCWWTGVTCSPDNRVVSVNLRGSGLGGTLNLSHLSGIPSLATLDLSANSLSAGAHLSVPYSLARLNLSFNNLAALPFASLHFGDCPNLTSLALSTANLSADAFPPTLWNCRSLQTLNLSHNNLRSTIPSDLARLASLTTLSLAHNSLSGTIPSHLGYRLCPNLQHLDLSANKLSAQLPFSFAACSSLTSLDLSANTLSGGFLHTVVTRLHALTHLNVAFNNITGTFPGSLAACTSLRHLDLSSNAFTHNIPEGFCSLNSALEKLLVANNYLSGGVPAELGKCTKLTTIDMSFNNLSGPIPLDIWTLPHLSELIMWANSITGTIPTDICTGGAGNLQMLILNNNLLSGALPESITNCTNIIWISLSSNRLTGQLPRGIGGLPNLAILQIGNNSLSGNIPAELGRCRSLIWLDLNSNNFTGAIPAGLADQSGMVVPGIVSGKQFVFVRNEGGTQCRGAGGLIEFEGVRPERLEKLPMVHSCSSTRIYSGMTVYTFGSNGTMIYLDLSYNTLSGPIPASLGTMAYLQVLNLGHNILTGEIPGALGGLRAVGVLDLSHNWLNGRVPGELATLSFLSDLDVSNNNLEGLIPLGGQLTTFPAARYDNNSGLCGLPLPPCKKMQQNQQPQLKQHRFSTAGFIMGFAMFGALVAVFALTLYQIKKKPAVAKDEVGQGGLDYNGDGIKIKKRKKRKKKTKKTKEHDLEESSPTAASTSSSSTSSFVDVCGALKNVNVETFEKPLRKLTLGQIVEATNGFSDESKIGTGGFGEVYKARLKDGCVVAIKKLIRVAGQGDREFMAEMETIGKIKHRNLVALLGYCKVGDERVLVYEYMPWGSLESVLHDWKTPVGWDARKRIAAGSARALAFLHHSCIPHIIHRDMKSSNVLLDASFEPRVSDFGMARLVNTVDTHLSVTTLAGTPGYVPPEYYQSFRCTTKGDVYSFGVVLLELLSRRRPIDSVIFGDNNLVGWARQLHRERRTAEIFDTDLLSGCSLEIQHQLSQYLQIAFDCLDDRPLRRPTMIQVLSMFKDADHFQTTASCT